MNRRSPIFEARDELHYSSAKSDHAVTLDTQTPGEVTVYVGGYPVAIIKDGAIRIIRVDNAGWDPGEFAKNTGLKVETQLNIGNRKQYPKVVFEKT